MSTREKCDQLLDGMHEFQLELVLAYMQGLTMSAEMADDRFCESVYQQYSNDPEKDNFTSEEELALELGVKL